MADPSLPQRLSNLHVPTLMVHGTYDPRPLWAVRRMADLMPNVQLTILTDAGHLLWLDQPYALRETLRQFLKHLLQA